MWGGACGQCTRGRSAPPPVIRIFDLSAKQPNSTTRVARSTVSSNMIAAVGLSNHLMPRCNKPLRPERCSYTASHRAVIYITFGPIGSPPGGLGSLTVIYLSRRGRCCTFGCMAAEVNACYWGFRHGNRWFCVAQMLWCADQYGKRINFAFCVRSGRNTCSGFGKHPTTDR